MRAQPHPLLMPAQLGQVLLAARKARQLSQATLARRLGLSQSRVSHLEQHADELSLAQLMAWCAALELELVIAPRGEQPEPSNAADW